MFHDKKNNIIINNNNYALDIIATFINPYIYMIDINCMLVINDLDSAVTNTCMCHFIIVTPNKNVVNNSSGYNLLLCLYCHIYVKNNRQREPPAVHREPLAVHSEPPTS